MLLLLLALAADAKPDFTVTADELTKAYETDGKAASMKYKGKIVEVSGPLHVRRPDDLMLQGHKPARFVSCTPDKASLAKHQRLYALARGQKVVFRGKMGDTTFSPVLGGCVLVSVGPNPAPLLNVGKILSGIDKLDEKPVVAKVRIVAIDKSEKSRVVYTVADAGSKGAKAATITVAVDTYFDSDRTKELHAIKPGEVFHAVGVAQKLGGPRLFDAVLVKDLPEGVKKGK